jgi:cytochrome c-type biogenesis protein CcmH/NrfF
MQRRRIVASALTALLVAVFAFASAHSVDAQQPTPTPAMDVERLEAQALSLERQLLCPQCTNKRLDVCEIAICQDMKSVIRTRLAAGATGDDILIYFSNRYGPRVLAQLPREGFNLWLWGWVGSSVAVVAALGGWMLVSQRRSAQLGSAASSPDPTDADDRWLDEQLSRSDS